MRYVLFIIIFIVISSCKKDEFTLDNIAVYTVAYDIYGETQLDVYTHKQCNYEKPVLIYVHGGGWCSGDKSEFDTPKVKYFCEHGYVCVSVNYRLSPNVMHPMHIKDVAKAIKWVESNIVEFGGDPSNILLIGHSAGAHLVALAVTNQRYLEVEKVNIQNIKAACLLDAGAYLIMDDLILADTDILDMIYLAVGSIKDSYLWKDFAPYNHINNNIIMPKMMIIHSDFEYRYAANKVFSDKLEECGKKYETCVLNGYSHLQVLQNMPIYFEKYNILQKCR